MSEKIKQKLADKESLKDNEVQLSPIELQYLNDIETVEQSFIFYCDRLKTNYLFTIADRLGYKSKQLEFEIDLKDPSGKLKIREVTGSTTKV